MYSLQYLQLLWLDECHFLEPSWFKCEESPSSIIFEMPECANCDCPLREQDMSYRSLVVCCDPDQRICSDCLLKFSFEKHNRVVNECDRCQLQLTIHMLKKMEQLYSAQLERDMRDSRVQIFQEERGYNPSIFRGSQGGTQRLSTRQQQHQPPQQHRINALQNYIPPPAQVKMIKRQLRPQECNLREDELGYVGQILYRQGRIVPIDVGIQNMSIFDNQEEEMELEQPMQTMRIGNHFSIHKMTKPEYIPEQQVEPDYAGSSSFGQSNYFSKKADRIKAELENNKRSISSNSKAYSVSPKPRPLSSHSRNDRPVESREDKSPPSFGRRAEIFNDR